METSAELDLWLYLVILLCVGGPATGILPAAVPMAASLAVPAQLSHPCGNGVFVSSGFISFGGCPRLMCTLDFYG